MQKLEHIRSDGRYLLLYAFDALMPEVAAEPTGDAGAADLELRWNPLLGEHVIVSTGRQGRTFLPPEDDCPLCPQREGGKSEIPVPTFEIAVFENRFPSLVPAAAAVAGESELYRKAAAEGVCEVVVYAAEHNGTLAEYGERRLRALVDVWCDRYGDLALRDGVAYVFIFENRGREIGVTLTHPHGQVYAFPFVPPRVQQEQAAAFLHQRQTGRCLLCDVVAEELAGGSRVIASDQGVVAFVPFAARVPYEVHVVAAAHRESLLDLLPAERDGLARILGRVQAAYDALWQFPMPYTMSMHQRATDGIQRAGDHLHIEFLPPYRTSDKLKYFASVETGAGTFINDTAPEEKAAELRAALARAGTPGGGRG